MYEVLPISKKLQDKTNKFNLNKKLLKAIKLLSNNPNHPSLHTELLEPKENGFHSFRINLKYRGIS